MVHWWTYASVNQVSIGSDNGLLPIWCQAINQNNAGLLSIWPLGTNFSEIWIKTQNFSFMKMHLNVSSAKWHLFCSGGDGLNWHAPEVMSNYILETWMYHSSMDLSHCLYINTYTHISIQTQISIKLSKFLRVYLYLPNSFSVVAFDRNHPRFFLIR